jgi:flagellar protein FlgJ
MPTSPVAPGYYADFSGLEALKAGARNHQKEALQKTTQQFESLLTRMMLKSMREASLGESLGDSQETDFYQDMFDQQLAVQLSQGKGLGLATHLLEQLMRSEVASATPIASTASTDIASGGDNKRQQFIQGLLPAAADAAKRLGVAPEAVIAHAALETGWGAHLPADANGSSFNLFGVKASDGGTSSGARALTTEFAGGKAVRVEQSFRRYDSLAAGIKDYVRLLGDNPRYASALNTGSNVTAFAEGLQRGGYATDPAYVQKLVSTAASVREILGTPSLKNAAGLPIGREGLST